MSDPVAIAESLTPDLSDALQRMKELTPVEEVSDWLALCELGLAETDLINCWRSPLGRQVAQVLEGE